jgi:hypothetical protein
MAHQIAKFVENFSHEAKKKIRENAVRKKQAEDYFVGLDLLVNGILKLDPTSIIQGLELLHRAFPGKDEFTSFIDMQGVYTCGVIYFLKIPQKIEGSAFKGFPCAEDRKAFCFNICRNNQSRDCKTFPENAIPLFNEGGRLSDCIIKALGNIALEADIKKIFRGEIDRTTFDNAIKFIDRIKNGTVKIAESPNAIVQPDLSMHKELRRIRHDSTKTTEIVERLAAKAVSKNKLNKSL